MAQPNRVGRDRLAKSGQRRIRSLRDSLGKLCITCPARQRKRACRNAGLFLFLPRDDFIVTLGRFVTSSRLSAYRQGPLQCQPTGRMRRSVGISAPRDTDQPTPGTGRDCNPSGTGNDIHNSHLGLFRHGQKCPTNTLQGYFSGRAMLPAAVGTVLA